MLHKRIMVLLGIACFALVGLAAKAPNLYEKVQQVHLPYFGTIPEEDPFATINHAIHQAAFELLDQAQDPENVLQYYVDATITYQTADILSVQLEEYLFAFPSAHGSHLYLGLNFDLQTGERLQLSDLFLEGSDYENIMNGYMANQIVEKRIPVFNLDDFQGVNGDFEFSLSEGMLHILFQEYLYTPYVYGPLMFDIPWEMLPLKKEWQQQP